MHGVIFTEQSLDKDSYMVTGNEYIFPDINAAFQFLIQQEKDSLRKDIYRQKAPPVLRPLPGLFNRPFNVGCLPEYSIIGGNPAKLIRSRLDKNS